ncbi:MAG: DUF255 domain-containing protein [Saprospiraceae bacterium]|nr:DUF255 domain-containing protein [Saprospiraceae bacterium]
MVDQKDQTSTTDQIQWMTWEEATEANKENPKKIFVDVYTKWCGYCKKMDRTTFLDESIIKELGDNFYAVKLDAEQRENINFNGSDFKFVPNRGRNGVHQLAYALLDGRMSFPSFVLLDETFSRIMVSPGYKEAIQLRKELEFASKEVYKEKSWNEFLRDSE